MAHLRTQEEQGRLSWLVGRARSLTGSAIGAISGDSSPASSSELSFRQWWGMATGGGCPYLSSGNEPPADMMMRCPYAASGREMPAGHPMIPGMLPKAADTATSKLLAVAKSTSTSPPGHDAAATIVQAAARGNFARQQQQAAVRTALDSELAGASNLTSLTRTTTGGGGIMAARLPSLTGRLVREPPIGASAGLQPSLVCDID